MRMIRDTECGEQTLPTTLVSGPLDGDVIGAPFNAGDNEGIICPMVEHPAGRVLLFHHYKVRGNDPNRADFVKTTYGFFDDGRGNPQFGPMKELLRRLAEVGGQK